MFVSDWTRYRWGSDAEKDRKELAVWKVQRLHHVCELGSSKRTRIRAVFALDGKEEGGTLARIWLNMGFKCYIGMNPPKIFQAVSKIAVSVFPWQSDWR
jgi:hypothetical protein